jgi:V/A-type H+-transporting ATPase subunit A
MLSRNYDGLQNDLDKLQNIFLQRGERAFPLDQEKVWDFKPLATPGEAVCPGYWLGEVKESWISHKIMAPFSLGEGYRVKSIVPEGSYKIEDTIAVLEDDKGSELAVSMIQRWPVKIPIKAFRNKFRPFKIMETGVRTIDTLNPITEGGTGFIPDPSDAARPCCSTPWPRTPRPT